MQGGGGQVDVNAAEAAEKEHPDVQEAPKDPKEEQPVQKATAAAPAPTPAVATPLTEELAKLKAQQARLKEIANSFTISHVIPTETSQDSHVLSEDVQQKEENHIEESKQQEVHEDEDQEQRNLEMESVD